MTTRKLVAAAGALTLALGGAAAMYEFRSPAAAVVRFRLTPVPDGSFSLMPESERLFSRVVIGLRPHGDARKAPGRKANDPREIELRRRLFGLDFELLHGTCMTAAPAYATFFVAVPDPATVAAASGEEEADFRAYLSARLGWSRETIERRVRFFRVPLPLLYPQDMAEILGLDEEGRLVLGVGADTDPVYAAPVDRIAREFPHDFTVRRLAGLHVGDINTEGGDVALSWLPEGKVGLLVGRHRVLRYFQRRTGESIAGRPLSAEKIEEARRAFSSAFFGVEVLIVGEEALRDPSRGSEALFHADMVVAALRNDREALAFVPTCGPAPRDATSGDLLSAGFVRDIQREYDLVGEQMSRRGYRVVRLPFEDHPVRAPVNVSKFVEQATGRTVVVLGRYRDHRPGPGGPTPTRLLAAAVDRLQDGVDAWETKRDDASFRELLAILDATWREVDAAAASANPLFEEQRSLYEKNGLAVRALALTPSGEGGVHCFLLR